MEGIDKNSDVRKPPRALTELQLRQIGVLQALTGGDPHARGASRPREIQELLDFTGLTDEREIQRVLYILEGLKLVTPCPPGDFTARSWQITTEGLLKLKKINKALAA